MEKDSSTFENASSAFRAHLPDLSSPRFTTAATQDVYEYANFFRDNHAPPWLFDLTEAWAKLYEEPFTGITSDGSVRENLFEARDEGVDVESVARKAHVLLGLLSEEQRAKLVFPVNAREWRAWSNPEILLRPLGLRLEELPNPTITAIHAILSASLSPEGYQKALSAMRINHFLGECVHLPKIMNKNSYNFLLFGDTPSSSPDRPWGWLLYGHHLSIACFLQGTQIVISPTFTGAEPNMIDSGPWKGTQILHTEAQLGQQLMQSLSPEHQRQAQLFEKLKDQGMRMTGDLLTDTWNKDDQRHLCGAYRDNRVVPPQGLPLSSTSLSPDQISLIRALAQEMLLYLPQPARDRRVDQIVAYLDETHFAWIGGWGDADAFYFRLQSPVVVLEFDHHSGVFLSNEVPERFHTHTIVRTPNAGDYGQAIRRGEHRL